MYAERLLACDVPRRVEATDDELEAVAEAGRAAWDTLIRAHLALVGHFAAREERRTGQPRDELFQEGCVGLIEALRRFDYRRGLRLATAAGTWIRAAMGRVDAHVTLTPNAAKWRDRRSRVRRMAGDLSQTFGRVPSPAEVALHAGEDVDRVVGWLGADADAQPVETDGGGADLPDRRWDPGALPSPLSAEVCALVDGLPPAERRVIEARYALSTGAARATWSQIATSLGMGVTTARRLEASALRRLRLRCEQDVA
jgi:RNA polymerase sigma factor (sigma-70 family)